MLESPALKPVWEFVEEHGTAIQIAIPLLILLDILVIGPYFMHPLSSIPSAHWSSPLSSFWITLLRYRLHENRTLLELHRKYGPIIRLSPNEISVNEIEGGVKTVFGNGFEKGHWYGIFDNYGVVCTFSALPSKTHSATKRMISHTYSRLNLFNSASLAAQSRHLLFERLLPAISAPGVEGLDVLSLFYASSMDAITAYQFGLSHSSDMIRDVNARKHFLDDLYQPRKQYAFFGQELPRLTKALSKIGIRLVPKWVDAANAEIEDWCRFMCDGAIEYAESGPAEEEMVENEPVVVRALLNGIEKEESKSASVLEQRIKKWKHGMVYTEMLDHLAAGHETSGITLTYAAYYLSKRPELQAGLRKELMCLEPPILFPQEGGELPDLPNPKTIDVLPLLNAILTETLRLNAAIPGSTPRMTPKGGCKLVGKDIPGGVRVSSAAWSLHRNADVFAKPDVWDHRRWLVDEKDEEGRKERERWFWAFSSGGRMCIGNNFAILQMKLTLAAIYSNFTSYVVDDGGIEQEDGYTCGPKGEKLILRFEKVKD